MSGPALTHAAILQGGIERAIKTGDIRRAAELRARLLRETARRHRRTRTEAAEVRTIRKAAHMHGSTYGCRETDGQLCRIRGCDWWRGWSAGREGRRSP